MTIPIEDLMGENQPVYTNPSPGTDETFAIMEGEGVGDYGDAPLTDVFGELAEQQGLPNGSNFWGSIWKIFGNVTGASEYVSSGGLVIDLTHKSLVDAQSGLPSRVPNRVTAIGELIGRLGLSYDEAARIVDSWSSGGVGSSPVNQQLLSDLNDELDNHVDGRPGGRPSGGGRRVAAPRVYAGPDRGLVEDWAKNQLVAWVGRADPDRVAMLTEKYFDADRKAFGGESIDPKQTVREAIREFDDYKRIHANRTDMDDEDTWISGQYSQLLNAGVSGQEAEKLAIDFAQAGVAKVRAGELSEARRVGSAPIGALPGFFNQVRQSLSTVARSVR